MRIDEITGKKRKIVDATSSHNNTTKDILIENGTITAISESIADNDATVIAHDNLQSRKVGLI
ncbi:MAG: hypothetical protein R2779_12375 [Crocinitomicaceae bacterium]